MGHAYAVDFATVPQMSPPDVYVGMLMQECHSVHFAPLADFVTGSQKFGRTAFDCPFCHEYIRVHADTMYTQCVWDGGYRHGLTKALLHSAALVGSVYKAKPGILRLLSAGKAMGPVAWTRWMQREWAENPDRWERE